MGCCASDWGFRATEDGHDLPIDPDRTEAAALAAGEVDLATALASERRYRAAAAATGRDRALGGREEGERASSLMKLLEEEEGGDGEGSSGVDRWWWCCVCMGRGKGAALIPCGHTFCRACAREMRAGRGACPLCNRPIADVLDIF